MNPTNIDRREFFARSAAGLAAASVLAAPRKASANPLGMPIGFQSWVVREQLADDFAGTLKKMAAIGYQTIEMCSPPGYASSGFGPLQRYKGAELRGIIHDAGLRCESCHYQFGELKKSLAERAAFAHELGLTQMVIASYGLPRTAKLADWRKACDETNALAAAAKKEGLQLAFHNHHFEVQKLDGRLIYDAMMAELDPALVKMQFQVAVISEGFEAAAFFKKYPGRFVSMHLADWSSGSRKTVAVGKGVVDWTALFAAAPTGGIKNYFVEVDPALLPDSYTFLHGLKA